MKNFPILRLFSTPFLQAPTAFHIITVLQICIKTHENDFLCGLKTPFQPTFTEIFQTIFWPLSCACHRFYHLDHFSSISSITQNHPALLSHKP